MLQETTVRLPAAALQSIGLGDGGCQGVQAHGLGVRVCHVDVQARRVSDRVERARGAPRWDMESSRLGAGGSVEAFGIVRL